MIVEEFMKGRVVVKVGDITEEDVDAIVNAANSTLLGGGGVDGAIHQGGGPQILEECKIIRETQYPQGLPTGTAVITSGGMLPAQHVIHTVGPIYGMHHGEESSLLADCYKNCLDLCRANNFDSVAFSAISTGVYGYPKDKAARISSEAVREFLIMDQNIAEIRFVFFSQCDADIFLKNHKF